MNLKSLAKMLDLSPTTVSRALNGYPEVSAKTRERVVAAAEAHYYKPSFYASGLAKGRSMTIGHVIPLAQHEMINPHFSDFLAGVGEVYAQHGYEMMLSVINEDDQEQAYRGLVRSQKVDGIVVHAPKANDMRIDLLNELAIPFVVHGRSDGAEASEYAWVDVNNREAFYQATDYLLDLGHRRIALINGQEHLNFAVRRRQGYEQAMSSNGVTIDERMLHSADLVETYGYHAMQSLLGLDEPPTAVLVASMIPAMGVLRAMSDAGWQMPEDLSVMVYDDQLSFLHYSERSPLFTSMRSSIREAGIKVANMLIQRIADPDAPPQQMILEAEFLVGQSTQPINR